MQHLAFVAINFVLLAIVIFLDKQERKNYFYVSLLALFFAFIFENITTFWGFWNYNSEPKILFISLYTWLLYPPYVCFCHFFVRRLFP